MLILYGFYKRKPGLSLEEFNHIWCNVYGALYQNVPDISRYMKRYIQHRAAPMPDPDTGAQFEYDGFSETWFESMADLEALWEEPYYKNNIKPIGATFLDLDGPKIMISDNPSYVVGDPPTLLD